MSPYFFFLALYSFFLIGIGWWTSRQIRNAGDFFVAGRTLSPRYLFATLLAANIGAGSTVGAAGLGYEFGFSAWWWVGSAGLGSLILGVTVGPRIWEVAQRHGFYTVGDFLEFRYNRATRGVIAVLLWFGTLAILAGQLIAVAWILNIVLGVERYVGALLGGMVMVGYFTFGGLLSAARVNAVQLVVKVVGFGLTMGFLFQLFDMWDAFPHLLEPISRTSESGNFGAFFGGDPGRVFGYVVLLVPSFIISPGLLQKIYGARDADTVRKGVVWNGVALMIFAFVPAILGMAARTHFPELDSREMALPMLLTESLPFWLGGLTLAAVFSAEVSSADAVLFMLSTSLSKDLYQTFVNPDATEEQLLRTGRITSVLAGILGVALAVILPSVISALSIFYSILSVALFVPLIAGLYSKRPGSSSALATIAGSISIMITIHFMTSGAGIAGLTPTTWGIGSAVVIMLGSVLVGRPRSAR
ncbi:MAG: sodium:solute symporter family protein [Candidatus Latescibacteria bacterium]|nr:sodium:solute symporter family protein [Candidatus Latescibacterota bacterium]